MTTRAPRGEARAGVLGGMQEKRSETAGWIASDEERDLRSEIRARAHAILAETSPLTGIDWESVSVIAEGIAEDIEAAT